MLFWSGGSRSHPEGAQPSHLRTSPCKALQDLWEVSPFLVCSQKSGPAFVLQKLWVNHVELLAGEDELARIPRGMKRGFVVCEWLLASLSSPASPEGANGRAIPIPAAFFPKLGSGKGRTGATDRCSGVKTPPVQRMWGGPPRSSLGMSLRKFRQHEFCPGSVVESY